MPIPDGIHAIDAWINLNQAKSWTKHPTFKLMKDAESRDEGAHFASYLFSGVTERTFDGVEADEIVALMDQAGIEKAILRFMSSDPDPALAMVKRYPERFACSVSVDPHLAMGEIRKLGDLVREYPFIKAVHMAAVSIQKPYNDKVYYPVYAKCVELDLPIMANIGIPAPRAPGACQNPIYLDEVCWFFPELKVVMTQGGEPWQFTCVKLMLKWPNLYYMTSAFVPSHYPQEIVHYMNTRGADKVMFATGYPDLSFDRCMSELKDLPLRDHVWPKFLRENAIKVFKLAA